MELKILCHAGWCAQSRAAISKLISETADSKNTYALAFQFDGADKANNDDDMTLAQTGTKVISEIFKVMYHVDQPSPASPEFAPSWESLAYEVPMMLVYKSPVFSINSPRESFSFSIEGAEQVMTTLESTIRDKVILMNKIPLNSVGLEFTTFQIQLYYKKDCHMADEYMPLWDKVKTYVNTFFYGLCTFTEVECSSPESLKVLSKSISTLPYVRGGAIHNYKINNKFKRSST